MRVTVGEIVDFLSPLPDLTGTDDKPQSPYHNLLSSGIPGHVQIRLLYMSKQMAPVLESFEEVRRRLVMHYGEQVKGTESYRIPDESIPELRRELTRLLTVEVDVPNYQIQPEDLSGLSLHPITLQASSFLIELPEDEEVQVPDLFSLVSLASEEEE